MESKDRIIYQLKEDAILQNTMKNEKKFTISSTNENLPDGFWEDEVASAPISSFFEGLDTQGHFLNNYIEKIPFGIFYKRFTGIGATTLEIDYPRNSIIVFPTKVLAYDKAKNDRFIYVGSEIEGLIKSTTPKAIRDYLKDVNIKYKKFLAVADSFEKVIKEIGENVYSTYFLMIDEIDLIQNDSHYRPSLETIMDYYFKFDVTNRCLVSATIESFSNPALKDERTFFPISVMDKSRRIINLIHTNNINDTLLNEIKSTNASENILIAYNTIKDILSVIEMLPENTQKQCSILCSTASKREAGIYFSNLEINKNLPNRVVFMTSSYFSGIDIKDKYHLITVSNIDISYQTLSVNRMTQIFGRCRIYKGILSDRIIYNTNRSLNAYQSSDQYRDKLILKANKLLDLYGSIDSMSDNDADLIKLFDIVKSAIEKKGTEPLRGAVPINLIRKKENGGFVPAYFNIDGLVEKMNRNVKLYNNPLALYNKLISMGHIVNPIQEITVNKSQEQQIIENLVENKMKENFDLDICGVIKEIRMLDSLGKLNFKTLKVLARNSKRNTKRFIERFMNLYEYAETDRIIKLLWITRTKNSKSYKTIKYAVIFWALDDNHPLKVDLRNVLEFGRKYSANDLYEHCIRAVSKYHFHKTLKPRQAITLLKAMYNIERPRDYYIIISENPKKFNQHKKRIPKDENNLIRLFEI